MEKQSLYIFKKDADGNKAKFPNADYPARLGEFTYTAQRMAGTPTLTATLYYPSCLDNDWTGNEWVEFRGEKYYIAQVPTSSKDNKNIMFKHELQFVSERIVLENVYFMDVVTEGKDTYHSNSTSVKFMGDINEFVARLNASMKKSGVGYSIVIDEGLTSEVKLITFDNTYIADALQSIYTEYDLPYYFVGKVCHVGYTEHVISTPFEYRKGLVSIKKTNANYKIVNRVTGVGSTDNISFYYPNDEQTGTIERSQSLMPSVYRLTKGAERFYNAKNNTYKIPGTDEFYTFENEYSAGNTREIKVDFTDIKPTIEGVENESGQLFGEVAGIAFDAHDNDEVGTGDANNVFNGSDEYVHSYFYLKLHVYNGEFGFNLFEQGLEGGTGMICMTTGNCAACEFEIGVTYQDGVTRAFNPVLVNADGTLPDGDFEQKVTPNVDEYIDSQQDTTTNEVWIAVKKDNQSFGMVMPNATNNYRPQVGDKFVITGIKMPKSLVLAAEKRLEEALIEYMSENNDEKFTFSVSFSRVFLAENDSLIETLNENARIYIRYNDREYLMYVNSITVKADKDCLYDISVELTDKLSANVSSLRSTITEIAGNVIGNKLSSSGGWGDIPANKYGMFLRKDIDDTAQKNITFCESIHSKGYIEGFDSGKGWKIDSVGDSKFNSTNVRSNLIVGNRNGSPMFISGFPNGMGWDLSPYMRTNAAGSEEKKWRLEIDDINVRGKMRVYEFVVSQLRGENDNVIFAGMMRVDHADKDNNIIYLDTDKGVLYNPFRAGDILMVQRFGGAPTAENGYNVVKQYELRVKEAYVGNLSDGENRVDWIEVEEFVGDWADVAERDVLTRVDSLTDSTRKGIVKVTTVDEIGAPYIDVVYGLKTDPEKSTKVRMGNLSGVRTRNNVDLTGVWGLYAEGAVFENSTYYMENGNTVEQNFTILNGKVESEISTIKSDMSLEAGNILKNSSFGSNLQYWNSVDEVHFLITEDGFVYASEAFYSEKNSVADIISDNGRNVLRIRNCSISQLNDVMNKVGIDFGNEESEQKPYFSFAFYYKVLTSGTLKVGFSGQELYAEEALSPNGAYVQYSKYAQWDGTGNFVLSYTGEILIYAVSLFNDKLADAKIYLEGKITQTEEALTSDYKKLIKDSEDNITQVMESKFQQTAEEISLLVKKEDYDADTQALTASWESKFSVQADSISAVSTRVTSLETASAGWITTADGNKLWASKTLENGNTIVSYINQTATTTTISSSRINLIGAVTFNSFSSTLQATINDKVGSSDLTTALAGYVTDSDLSDELKSYALASTLSNYVSSDALATKLANYATTAGVSSTAQAEAKTAVDALKKALVDGSTTIVGGVISTSLIDVDNLYATHLDATVGTIAGFTLSANTMAGSGCTLESGGAIKFSSGNRWAAYGVYGLEDIGGLSPLAAIWNKDTNSGDKYGLYIRCDGYDVNENIRLQYSASGSFKKTILGFRHYSGGGTADAQSFKRALIQTDKMPFDWHVEKTYGKPDGKHVMYDLNSGVFYVIN